MKQGYVVTVWSKNFSKGDFFFDYKPTEAQLEKLIEENGGVKCYIRECELYESKYIHI